MKKKIVSLVMASMMAILAVGCGSSSATTNESTETAKSDISTVTAGKLTVATSPDFAPYEFYAVDESGTPQLAGFDIALAQYIADYLGLELEVVPVDLDLFGQSELLDDVIVGFKSDGTQQRGHR